MNRMIKSTLKLGLVALCAYIGIQNITIVGTLLGITSGLKIAYLIWSNAELYGILITMILAKEATVVMLVCWIFGWERPEKTLLCLIGKFFPRVTEKHLPMIKNKILSSAIYQEINSIEI